MLVFDHIAISASTLAEGVAHVEAALGVTLAGGGQHPHMATHNRLLNLGDLYLEVIATDPAQPRPAWPRWFDLDRFSGPPRLTNWVAACDDLAAEIAASPAIEVALDRLGLRRRLDDDEHTLRSHIRSCLPPPWDARDRWGVCAARGCRCQIRARRPRPTPYGGERRDGRSAMREGQVVMPRGR